MATSADAVAEVAAELITKRELAKLMGQSVKTVERLRARGRLLAPVEFSKVNHRWRREEVLAWIRCGCPDQATWEQMKRGQAAKR